MEGDITNEVNSCTCVHDEIGGVVRSDSGNGKDQTHHHGDDDEDNDLEDGTYYNRVCRSYRHYATFNRCQRYTHAWRMSSLPERQRSVLPKRLLAGTEEWNAREKCFQSAELHNQYFLDCILKYHGQPTSQEQLKLDQEKTDDKSTNEEQWSSDDDISKVQSVLKSVARDWSKEMANERRQSYGPLLEALERYLPIRNYGSSQGPRSRLDSMDSGPTEVAPESSENGAASQLSSPAQTHVRISVPGAGVSRLALEVASRGYEVQGNEFSFHMLLASDFVLNGCWMDRPFRIAPWLGSTRNLISSLDPTRQYSIPDVDPASMLLPRSEQNREEDTIISDTNEGNRPEFSMVAGDFRDVYNKGSEHEKWDGIVSCFFLDTAPSIVEYLQVMWNMLTDGGYLLNFGPLLYHWSAPPSRPSDSNYDLYRRRFSYMDERYTESIDLSWDDIRHVMCQIGFELIEEKLGLPATYTADDRCMMNSRFECVYFVARKVKTQKDKP